MVDPREPGAVTLAVLSCRSRAPRHAWPSAGNLPQSAAFPASRVGGSSLRHDAAHPPRAPTSSAHRAFWKPHLPLAPRTMKSGNAEVPCFVDLFLTLRSEIVARILTVEASAGFPMAQDARLEAFRCMTNVIKLADRRPRKAPASPPDHDWVGHYQERLDQDSDRLRKLLLRDFNDPEVLREWREAVERLRYNTFLFTRALRLA